MAIKLDYMEYSSNANAQAAYVTNATEAALITQNQHDIDNQPIGNLVGSTWYEGQSFTFSIPTVMTAVSLYFGGNAGTPTGQVTYRIETDSSGSPSGTLANANATVTFTPSQNGFNKQSFTPFTLSAGVYHIVANCAAQSVGNYWQVGVYQSGSVYAGGNQERYEGSGWIQYTNNDLAFLVYGIPLQCYSENTIKTQGSYSLKSVANITASSGKTLTLTIGSPLNLSNQTQIKFDIYSNRTGSNIKLGIHDTGGITTEITPNITGVNAWQNVSWNISGVSNANKDAIDKIIVTIVDASNDNVFYIDNMYAIAWVPKIYIT